MTEQRPWLDSGQASPRVLELLRSAAPTRALDRATRERSRRRVAALGALPAAAGVFFVMQHVALGALVGTTLIAGASVAGVLRATSDVPTPIVPVLGHAQLPSLPATPASARPEAPPVEAAPREPAPPPKLAAEPKADAAADLVREAKLLEIARKSLERAPARALALLSQHQREFRTGSLRLEREFLTVVALIRLGRTTEARAHAARLRALNPGSLYEQRLVLVLGENRAHERSSP